MGTRHLIAVQKNGRYGIANYGQWDGYPSGQGIDVLTFARNMDREAFGAKVAATRFIEDEEEIAKINSNKDWPRVFPELSRDAGSDILDIVNDAEPGLGLLNSLPFAWDSLFCEYAYVIDLDAGTFECFRGFNKSLADVAERFAGPVPEGFQGPNESSASKYNAVSLWHKWPLDALPSDEEFLAIEKEGEEDEE